MRTDSFRLSDGVQGDGKRSRANKKACPEILSNANTATGRLPAYPSPSKQSADGGSDAWSYKGATAYWLTGKLLILLTLLLSNPRCSCAQIGDGHDESTDELAGDPANHARIREGIPDDGLERGNDERCCG